MSLNVTEKPCHRFDRNRQFNRNFLSSRGLIPQQGGVETLTLRFANLPYIINVCAKFKLNWVKIVGGVRDTKLLVLSIRTDTRTHGQTN